VKRLAVLLVCLLLSVPALAWDLNKDLTNTTGQIANDLEIILDGTVTVTGHYDGDAGAHFTNFTTSVQTMNGAPRTVLSWSGLSIAPGGTVHVGYSAGTMRCLGAFWTHDGQTIGPVTQVDLQSRNGGFAIQATNDLSYSLWPTWPFVPPSYEIGPVTVYYFSSGLPLSSLNAATLPSWTPLRVNVLVPSGSPVLIGSGLTFSLTDPRPAPGATASVWVLSIDSGPGTSGARDFAQLTIDHPIATEGGTWGGLKSLFR
jgi:hypothetical protein